MDGGTYVDGGTYSRFKQIKLTAIFQAHNEAGKSASLTRKNVRNMAEFLRGKTVYVVYYLR